MPRVCECEVEPREVERDGQARASIVDALAQMMADAVDDIGIELVDEVRFLEHGDEVRGREAAMRRGLPARERLDAADLSSERADDGLVVDLEEALLKRSVEVLADVVADGVALAHLLRVGGPAMVRIALDGIAGELRLVESILEDGFVMLK